MKNAVWIWIVRVVSLCVLGPIAGGLMSSLRAADGSGYATALVSGSLVGGIFALVGVFFLAMIGGVIATKAVSLREGVLNMGLVVAWGAWGSGQVGEALRSAPESGSLVMLVVEGVVVLVLTMWVLVVLSKASQDDEQRDACVRLDGFVLAGMLRALPTTLMLVGIGIVVSMLIVWLQVQTDLSGQAVWGGFIGSAFAGVLGGMMIKNHSMSHGGSGGAVRSSHQPVITNRYLELISKAMVSFHKGKPEREVADLSLVTVILGILLAGVLGPLVALVVPGSGKLLESIASGSMPGYLLMSSLAWSGGALIGTPIGYSWVESSVARQQAGHATA